MSQKNILTGALVFFACALAVWLFTSGGDKESSEVAKTPAVEAKVEKTSAPNKKAGGKENRQREVELLFDDDPEGTLRLEGHVFNSEGASVAGAIVSLDSRPPKFTKSEDDGSFFFEKLVGRPYDIVARASVGVAGPVTAHLSETTEPVILTLSPGGQVTVKVVSAESPEGASGVNVELRGLDVQNGTTDEKGEMVFSQVPVGRFRVVAHAEGYTPARDRVSVSRSGAQAETKLRLEPGQRVTGRVVDESGKPVAEARVIYRGASSWGTRASPRLDGVLSDASGKFEFEALPGGSFRFTATADGFSEGSSGLVSLSTQHETTSVEVVMEAEATLRGKVSSQDGEGVAAARVRVAVKTSGRMGPRQRTREVFSDDKGNYELSGLSRKEYQVIALHESASSSIEDADLSVAPHDVTLPLTLDVDGVIAGIVVDSAGEPIAGAQVSVVPNFRKTKDRSFGRWRMSGMEPELTDSGGQFRVTGLDKKEFYSVRATPGGANSQSRRWQTEPVDARAGDEELRIVLPADGGIKGKVVFANGESPTSFTVSTGWQKGTPFFSDDGSFELGDLPPQEYTVSIRGPGFEQRQIPKVMVEEGKVVDLSTITVAQGRTVSGRVIDSNGSPVAGAIVSVGRVTFGDGSSAKASGVARNPLARETKTAESGESGEFEIFGSSLGDLNIVADHDTLGRSMPVSVQLSNESIVGLELTMLKTGSLQGVVRKSGAPESGVIITAASTSVTGVTFNVATGNDGSYRFDRLVPDQYRVKAMAGGNPMRGMSYSTEIVTVQSEQSAELDFELSEGGTTLKVSLTADRELGFSYVTIAPGALVVKTARELNAKLGQGSGFEAQGMSIRGMPASAPGLQPGDYTVCVTVYPTEVSGMAPIMDYIGREGDNLLVTCQRVTIGTEAEQSMTIKVTIPDYVPGPEDKPDETKPDDQAGQEGDTPQGSATAPAN